MLVWIAGGLLLLAGLAILSRWFVSVSPADLARAARTFLAITSALASTGLLVFGRWGLALVALISTVLTVRALLSTRAPPSAMGPDPGVPPREARTRWLLMRIDRAQGLLSGEVLAGRFAGRPLSSLDRTELDALHAEIRREDPASLALLEAWLDRHHPDWRARQQAAGEGAAPGPGDGSAAMDDRLALEILGLAQGASEEEVRAAHRRLMGSLHPDRGGSTWIAARVNQAKDHLLRRDRAR